MCAHVNERTFHPVKQWLIAVRLTENSMFFLSWLTALGSGTGSVCLSTDTDSPVKMDWSTLRVVERIEVSLMSAGTLSPTGEAGTEKKKKRKELYTLFHGHINNSLQILL